MHYGRESEITENKWIKENLNEPKQLFIHTIEVNPLEMARDAFSPTVYIYQD